jgi:hypothetical protein
LSDRQTFAAQLAPQSFDDSDGSIGLIVYTGATVDRYDWMTGERYTMAMDVSADAVDLSRLDAGTAHLLDGHNSGGVADIFGVLLPGSATFANGELRVRAKLSEDPAKSGVVADVRAGIIRGISVGAELLEVQETKAEKGRQRHVQVKRWQPFEASLVPIPADAGAQTFSRVEPAGVPTMPENQAPAVDLEAVKMEARTEERARLSAIDAAGGAVKAPAELIAKLKAEGVSVNDARGQLLDFAAKAQEATATRPQISMLRDAGDTQIEEIKAALLAKANPGKAVFAKDPMANRYRGKRLVDLARAILDTRGVDHTGFSDEKAARKVLFTHSTSDFPDVLGDAIGKGMLTAYAGLERQYEEFTSQASFSGLYDRQAVLLSGIGAMTEVAQGADYPMPSLSDSKETYGPVKYGAQVGLTLEALLKDNLDAFGRIPAAMAQAARNKENAIIAALFAAGSGYGPTLAADSVALFNSAHANLVDTGAGGVPTLARIDALNVLLASQTDAQANKLAIKGKFIVVPSALKYQTEALLFGSYMPTGSTTAVTPSMSALKVIGFDFLASSVYWYLFADPTMAPVIEWAQPDNTEPLTLEMEDKFENDTRVYKSRLWFGAAAVDYRGAAQNRGA